MKSSNSPIESRDRHVTCCGKMSARELEMRTHVRIERRGSRTCGHFGRCVCVNTDTGCYDDRVRHIHTGLDHSLSPATSHTASLTVIIIIIIISSST